NDIGKSIRTLGVLDSLDTSGNFVILKSPKDFLDSRLRVDISLLNDGAELREDTAYTLIGEIIASKDVLDVPIPGIATVRARIMVNSNQLDYEQYERALKIRRMT